jgi:hypothetical protein
MRRAVLTSPEHLLRDGHLQYIAREFASSVGVIDTRGAFEDLHHSFFASNL